MPCQQGCHVGRGAPRQTTTMDAAASLSHQLPPGAERHQIRAAGTRATTFKSSAPINTMSCFGLKYGEALQPLAPPAAQRKAAACSACAAALLYRQPGRRRSAGCLCGACRAASLPPLAPPPRTPARIQMESCSRSGSVQAVMQRAPISQLPYQKAPARKRRILGCAVLLRARLPHFHQQNQG